MSGATVIRSEVAAAFSDPSTSLAGIVGFALGTGTGIVHAVVQLATGGQARLLATTITHFAADGSIVFDHTRITLTPL
jgi:hypothetical protein